MRELHLGVAQRLLGVLALRQIEHEGDALVLTVAERRRAEQNRHAAAVFAKVLFLTRLDGSSRLQLCDGPVVGVVPFGRRQFRPSQPIRTEIFPGISAIIRKGLVGFVDPASASAPSAGLSSLHRSRSETRSSRAYPTISRKAWLASMIRP